MRSKLFNTDGSDYDNDYINDNDAVENRYKCFQVESGLNYSSLKTVL